MLKLELIRHLKSCESKLDTYITYSKSMIKKFKIAQANESLISYVIRRCKNSEQKYYSEDRTNATSYFEKKFYVDHVDVIVLKVAAGYFYFLL